MDRVAPVDSSLQVQRDGVNAIARITGEYDESDWQRPTPCEGWTATDLAGHLVTAIDNWHVLLDDSEARASGPRFAWAEMDQFFKDRLAALPPGTGPERIGQFVDRAEQYFDRVHALDPELPLVSAFPDVTPVPMTIGLFAWLGGIEWHVHAWDFARTTSQPYRTDHAATLHEAAAAVFGGTVGDEDPWEAILNSLRPGSDRS